MKIRVHIHNRNHYMHKTVYVQIEVDHIPVVGQYMWLINKDQETIKELATASLDTLEDYKTWVYGDTFTKLINSNHTYELQDIDKKNLSFSDAIYVKDVAIMYDEDEKRYISHIELDGEPEL